MPKRMTARRLGDARFSHGVLHRVLQILFVHMMASLDSAVRINRYCPGNCSSTALTSARLKTTGNFAGRFTRTISPMNLVIYSTPTI
jgi:hypothetical protein